LASRATDSNREIALTLVDIVGQQKRQHVGDFVQKFLCLRELTDIFRHLGMLSSQFAKFGDEVRVGKKPNVEDQVCIAWDAVFESKTSDGNREVAIVFTYATRELCVDVRAEFMDIETRRIEKDIRDISNRIEPSALSAYRCGDRLSATKRMRSARLREPPNQCVVRSFKEDNPGR